MKRLFTFFTVVAILVSLNHQQLFSQLNGSAGTEFYFSFPPCYEVGSPGFIRVYVSSEYPAEVTLSVKGFTSKKILIPNDMTEFTLSPAMAQAYLLSGSQESPEEQVWEDAAVHITSDAPIVVYGVTRFPYTSDGFLALPVSALGTDYVLSSYPDMTAMYPGLVLPSITTITASFDNTELTFTVGGTATTQTSGGKRSGETITKTLNAGDVFVVATKGDLSDLSGSRIQSTMPVCVTSGNMCANVPVNNPWCDFLSETDLPMHTWGTDYHVTKIKDRIFNSVLRIYAKEDNTNWFLNGQSMGLILKGSGGKQNDAWIEYRIPGNASNNVISADKPIYVVQYNTGQADDNQTSDPFQLVLTPIQQFQKEITFCTPGIQSGVGFAKNFINLVYELDGNNAIPDDLEFAVVNNGAFHWEKVSAVFGASIGEKFAVPVNGKEYASKILQLPGDGVYKLRANTGFAAYANGFSDYDSYGYPAALVLADLTNTEGIPPVVVKNVEASDGTVQGKVSEEGENSSKLASVFLDRNSSKNYRLDVEKFVPGQSSEASWSLSVIDKNKDAKAKVIFVDRSGNSVSEIAEYAAISADVEVDPASQIILSPNPATTSLKVVSKGIQIERIILLNILGEKILEKEISSGENISLDVRKFPAGFYTVQCLGKDTKITKELIISR